MEELTLQDLLAQIQHADDKVRAQTWSAAGPIGAAAVAPLAKIVAEGELEISRAAKRAIWSIVRHVGRPDKQAEMKQPVVDALVGLLGDDQKAAVRREALWMISELGDGAAEVTPVAALLANAELREDARCCLERLPGEKVTAALQAGLKAAADDYKPAIAHSLRVRGVDVPDVPCMKLVPTKTTTVKPVGP